MFTMGMTMNTDRQNYDPSSGMLQAMKDGEELVFLYAFFSQSRSESGGIHNMRKN